MNGIYPQYTGPTEDWRLASLYPRWTGGFLFEAIPELGEAANEPGSVTRPFKRIAVTPEVMAQIRAEWEVLHPTVIVPADPALRAEYIPPTPQPDRFAGTKVVELTNKVVVALPQFNMMTVAEVAEPVTGVSIGQTSSQLMSAGNVEAPVAGSTPEPVAAQSLAYRTILFPETIKNPTDEQLVAILSNLV